MPIPSPGADESKDDFLGRCHSALADEFTDSAQRHAVCLDAWESDRGIVTGNRERRILHSGRETELRIAQGDRGPMITGYAVVFNSFSQDLGGGWFENFREVIKPEAVERTFRENIDVRAFVDHDPAKILGRVTAGTLRMKPDERGLRVEIEPGNQSYARDVIESIQRRDISGMSFAFSTVKRSEEHTSELQSL